MQENLVVVAHSIETQSTLWQAVLSSQNLLVVLEPKYVDLRKKLAHAQASNRLFPQLLLIDIHWLLGEDFYNLCRDLRDLYPGLKVILSDSGRDQIRPTVRKWAITQGASDFSPKITADNAVAIVSAALNVLGVSSIDRKAMEIALSKTDHNQVENQSENSNNQIHAAKRKRRKLKYRGAEFS